MNELEDEKMDRIDAIVFDTSASLPARQQALAFVMDHTEGFDEVDGKFIGLFLFCVLLFVWFCGDHFGTVFQRSTRAAGAGKEPNTGRARATAGGWVWR